MFFPQNFTFVQSVLQFFNNNTSFKMFNIGDMLIFFQFFWQICLTNQKIITNKLYRWWYNCPICCCYTFVFCCVLALSKYKNMFLHAYKWCKKMCTVGWQTHNLFPCHCNILNFSFANFSLTFHRSYFKNFKNHIFNFFLNKFFHLMSGNFRNIFKWSSLGCYSYYNFSLN